MAADQQAGQATRAIGSRVAGAENGGTAAAAVRGRRALETACVVPKPTPTVPLVDLRVEEPDDREAVRDLHLRAFGDHGGVVAGLVDALRAAPDGLSLVAVRSGHVVGHVMFTRSLLDTPRRLVEVRVLSPLAVIPEHQREGIGSALVRRGLQIMAERSVPLVFLEGSPGYYSRFGFAAGGGLGFRKPSLRIPDAAFQAVRLPAFEPWLTGTLVYSETFWQHDAVGLRDPAA